MPRKRVPQDPEYPFHVVARAHNRQEFDRPMEELWEMFSERLYYLHHVFGIRILSFVLMPNHFHGILRAPQGNRSRAVADFMRESAKELNRRTGRINQVWGGRHFSCRLGSPHYFLNTYKYVYQNPLRAGLCRQVEDYPWSSLQGLLGRRHLLIPIQEDATLFSDFEGTLRWLNQPPHVQDLMEMKKALSRRTFKLCKDLKTRDPHWLETALM